MPSPAYAALGLIFIAVVFSTAANAHRGDDLFGDSALNTTYDYPYMQNDRQYKEDLFPTLPPFVSTNKDLFDPGHPDISNIDMFHSTLREIPDTPLYQWPKDN